MNNMIAKREDLKMKIGMKVSLVGVSLIMAWAPLFASGKGTTGAQFLRIGVGARGPAMAGAFSPIADDATAIYWNPAGMALVEKRELSLSYNVYFEDTAAQFLGYAHPTSSHGTFGGAVNLFGVRDIEKRSATGGDADTPDLGTFNTQDMALSVGWANKLDLLGGAMHYGMAVKYIRSDLNTDQAATGAVDLGAIHKFGDSGLYASLAVLNLGGKLKFDSTGDPLPLDIKPGVAYKMNLGRYGKLTTALDGDILVNEGVGTTQAGLEWRVHPMVALRTGYQFGRDEDAGSGVGVGVGLNLLNLTLDYAFVPYGDLGDTHRMALGLKF